MGDTHIEIGSRLELLTDGSLHSGLIRSRGLGAFLGAVLLFVFFFGRLVLAHVNSSLIGSPSGSAIRIGRPSMSKCPDESSPTADR